MGPYWFHLDEYTIRIIKVEQRNLVTSVNLYILHFSYDKMKEIMFSLIETSLFILYSALFIIHVFI